MTKLSKPARVLQGCDQHRLPPSEMLETGASRELFELLSGPVCA